MGNTTSKFHLIVLSAARQYQRDISLMMPDYQAQTKADIFTWRAWPFMNKQLQTQNVLHNNHNVHPIPALPICLIATVDNSAWIKTQC